MLEIKQKPHQRVVHHTSKLSPVLRGLRRVLIAATILALLFIVGALIYTWYTSKNSTPAEVTSISKLKKPTPVVSPTKPSPTARVSASVQLISSPVKPGDNATIAIRTNADANCTIKVEYNTVVAKDSGLIPKKANEFGVVTWAWTVPVGTPLGKWPVTVTCANLKNSAMVVGDLVVAKTAPVN